MADLLRTVFWRCYSKVYNYLWNSNLLVELCSAVVEAIPSGEPVLDVGAGTGLVAEHLLGAGHPVTACEPNPAMADRLARRLPAVPLMRTALERLAPASATNVIAVNVLHMVSDPTAAIARLRAICRPGGRVVIVTPVPGKGLLDVAAAHRAAGAGPLHLARFVAIHVLLAPLTALAGMAAAGRVELADHALRAVGDVTPVARVYQRLVIDPPPGAK